MNFYLVNQLPLLSPEYFEKSVDWLEARTVSLWFSSRTLELVYTSWDLKPFAQDLGYGGVPFGWDPDRRFLIRCEIDAALFHLYGTSKEEVEYIIDTFTMVKRSDEANFGEYRTKRVILEIYYEMQKAITTGIPYQTRLDPPPADPGVADSPEGR
jgi:hypothetical protein